MLTVDVVGEALIGFTDRPSPGNPSMSWPDGALMYGMIIDAVSFKRSVLIENNYS